MGRCDRQLSERGQVRVAECGWVMSRAPGPRAYRGACVYLARDALRPPWLQDGRVGGDLTLGDPVVVMEWSPSLPSVPESRRRWCDGGSSTLGCGVTPPLGTVLPRRRPCAAAALSRLTTVLPPALWCRVPIRVGVALLTWWCAGSGARIMITPVCSARVYGARLMCTLTERSFRPFAVRIIAVHARCARSMCCARSLCMFHVRVSCARFLCACAFAVRIRCARSLCAFAVRVRCARSLCAFAVRVRCARSLCAFSVHAYMSTLRRWYGCRLRQHCWKPSPN